MICEKGIFDLLRMNTNDMVDLEFSESDFSLLLAHKCDLLIKRDVKILGSMLFTPDELRRMDRDTILKMVSNLSIIFVTVYSLSDTDKAILHSLTGAVKSEIICNNGKVFVK